MTDSGTWDSPTRLRLYLAAVFVVAIVAAEITDVSAPAIGLDTAFDVQAAIIGTFIFLLGAVHVTHATEAAENVVGGNVEVSPTDIQRAGALTAAGGVIVLVVAFL